MNTKEKAHIHWETLKDHVRSGGFWIGAPFWIVLGILIGLMLKNHV